MTALWSQEIYIAAYQFAAQAHHGQRVPGTHLPYLVHVSLVCMEVMTALTLEPEHDGDLAIQCALLHDVLEDTETTYDQLQETFGAQVAEGVLALSKDKRIEASQQLADSLRRIRLQPAEVWMVKLADRITNLQTPPKHWTREKITRYRAEAIEIQVALKNASPVLEARLADKIERYAG